MDIVQIMSLASNTFGGPQYEAAIAVCTARRQFYSDPVVMNGWHMQQAQAVIAEAMLLRFIGETFGHD